LWGGADDKSRRKIKSHTPTEENINITDYQHAESLMNATECEITQHILKEKLEDENPFLSFKQKTSIAPLAG